MTGELGDRYTVDELMTLHSVEQLPPEVLVEGRTDAIIVQWLLSNIGLDAEVFPAKDRVQIDFEAPLDDGDFGDKAIVVAASGKIATDEIARERITCIADADYWHTIQENRHANACLLVTDYSSMDAYLANEEVLGKFLRLVLRASRDLDPKMVLEGIDKALTELFAARWVLKHYEPAVAMFAKVVQFCRKKTAPIAVDIPGLLRQSLTDASIPNSYNVATLDLVPRVNAVATDVSFVDMRLRMNGHDFFAILTYYLTSMHPQLFKEDRQGFKDSGVLENSLRGCLDYGRLQLEPMFDELAKRIRRIVPYTS